MNKFMLAFCAVILASQTVVASDDLPMSKSMSPDAFAAAAADTSGYRSDGEFSGYSSDADIPAATREAHNAKQNCFTSSVKRVWNAFVGFVSRFWTFSK